MAGILSLKPEDTKKLHPEALKWFNDQRAMIQCEVPLEELGNDDLNEFLSGDEKRDFMKYKGEITRGLARCMDTGDGASRSPGADATIGLTIVGFKVESLLPMRSIWLLLKKVYERKVAKEKELQGKREEEERRSREQAEAQRRRKDEEAKAERREKEAEERWWVAYKALNIPSTDASTYLKPEEREKFADSILGAVDAYLNTKESYILDSRADAYLLWINEINKRKEEERQQIIDNLAAREFNNSLSKHIAGLKSRLNDKRRDLQNYFTAKVQDKRYTGHNFDYVLDNEQKRGLDSTLVRVANHKLKQIIPPDLLEFIEIPSTYYRLYFPLPSIGYRFEGIPCLDFSFKVFATAYAGVLLKPKVKKFGICSFNLPAEKEGNVLVPLEEPKLLGYFYILLTPKDLDGYTSWRVIPLVLLSWLLEGGTKPPGITIPEASDDSITYKVQKFKEEVDIPDKFADYLKNIGGFDTMLNTGIVNDRVASIVRSLDGQRSESSEELKTLKGRKAKAFQLFNEGRRPSDSEVKSLGIKPTSAYRYYQQWKKGHYSR